MKKIERLENINGDEIYYMTEYDGFYYIKTKEDGLGLWKIDKKTHLAELTDTISYVCDPVGANGETLKELAKVIVEPGSAFTGNFFAKDGVVESR